jgi:hypothetical protein
LMGGRRLRRGDAGDAAGLGDLADRGEEDIRVAILQGGGALKSRWYFVSTSSIRGA